MADASRTRPDGAVTLRSLAGHVRARPTPVFDALATRFAPSADFESLYLADRTSFLIIEQAGGWYRGEYRVVPDQDGSNVEHQLLDLTPARRRGRTARRIVADAPAQFERLLRQLRLELE